MLDKASRLALLKSRHAALFGVALAGLLPVSRVEISREARAVKSKIAESMNDDTSDGDRIEIPVSRLTFDESEPIRESDASLSLAERRQLARDVALYRAANQHSRPLAA